MAMLESYGRTDSSLSPTKLSETEAFCFLVFDRFDSDNTKTCVAFTKTLREPIIWKKIFDSQDKDYIDSPESNTPTTIPLLYGNESSDHLTTSKVDAQIEYTGDQLFAFAKCFPFPYKITDSSIYEKASITNEQVNVESNSEFVTGRLVGINLQEKYFQIQLMSGRSLDVDYSGISNAESVLIKNRNNVLHVHGQVTYNEFDELMAISNADQLLTVDTRLITMNEFVIESEHYKINPPLKFVVDFDYDEYFYTLKGDFDIFLIGDSRIEVEDDLDYSLKLFWADYVQEKSEKLAADAQIVGREMLQRFKVI